MRAQHLVLHLGTVVRVEEIFLEELASDRFGLAVQSARAQQYFFFQCGEDSHAGVISTTPTECPYNYAHINGAASVFYLDCHYYQLIIMFHDDLATRCAYIA